MEGDDPAVMHPKMAEVMEHCVLEIRAIQQKARSAPEGTPVERQRWPMIVLRSPKGWTCPKEVDGHKLEGSWRAHQMPILDPKTNPEHLKLVEQWLRSYRPEELFDESGSADRGAARASAEGDAAHLRKSACEWRPAAQAAADLPTSAIMP